MNITGKIFLFLLCMISQISIAQCDISVKVLSYTGEPLKTVAVGVPFQIHIIGNGDCDVTKVEFGASFDLCQLSSLGVVKSLTSINNVNKRAVVHKYLARIDQPGHYQLGPITALHEQDLLGSLQLAIDAIEEKNSAVEFKIDHEPVYVGEQFKLTVVLHVSNMQLTMPKLQLPPDLRTKIDFTIISAPARAQYQQGHFEWQIAGVAKQTGQLMLPAVQVSFEKVGGQSNFFMFSGAQSIELFSNIIRLNVLDLPFSNQAIHGIGSFTGFIAKVDHKDITSKRAAQLTLELMGDTNCNWSKINIAELANLPPNLQAYPGIVTEQEQAKKFEFVLQGIKTGECTVPAQRFYYFDPKAKIYKTLATKPLKLNVLSIHDLPVLKPDATNSKQKNNLFIDDSIKPICETWENRKFHIPNYLFCFLMLLPILILILHLIWNLYRTNSKNNFKTKFKRLKIRLISLTQHNQPELLYDFFAQVFIQLFNCSQHDFKLENIIQILTQHQVLPAQIQAFEIFYHHLAQLKFGGNAPSNMKQELLFAQAEQWLIFLRNLK